ncbi:O-antigen ligase family protein [Carnobacterium mobile]|uniref:O-antigen ligase family protein n=1 Tax=Carnobacterium mobile TaxID=2750 RepID=UPI001867B2C1|nr:O-antigen ligase family protein [Carnobacterium mobile]
MVVLTYLILLCILIGWIYGLCNKNVTALSFLLIISTVYYPSITNIVDVDFIIKVLFLITALYYLKLYGLKKHSFKFFFLAMLLYSISFINAQWDTNYSYFDSITAFFSLSLGLILYSVAWPEKMRVRLLKVICKLPFISIILGLLLSSFGLLDFIGRNGTGLAGASMATNLSFFGVNGIIAAIILRKELNSDIYRGLIYINFLITALTLTRGGILAGSILLIPDFFSFLKNILQKKKYIMISLISFVSILYPLNYIYKNILERTVVNGQINTSGRVDAWTSIINLSTNKLLGNGYGFLKTVTDTSLRAFTAAHNEYIRMYVETGYVGIVIIVLIFWLIFKKIIKENNNIIVYLTILLSFMLYSYTDNTMTNFRFWLPFMIIIGLIDNHKKVLKFKR